MITTKCLRDSHQKRPLPENLICGTKNILPEERFLNEHLLFRSFTADEFEAIPDEDGNILEYKIKKEALPGGTHSISCNWSLFSEPRDIWYAKKPIDSGCYALSVDVLRDKDFNFISLKHSPIVANDECPFDNYSHSEICKKDTEGKPSDKDFNKASQRLKMREKFYENDFAKIVLTPEIIKEAGLIEEAQ